MPAATTPESGSYIRGGGGVEIDPRRIVRPLAAICILALAGLSIGLAVDAGNQNGRAATLRKHGVPVTVSVTGCLAVSSGIGMGVEYWQCRGDFSLGGHRYNEVIGGSRALLEPGRQVAALAVPGQPASLSTVASVAEKHSSFTPYVTPVVLGAVAVVWAGGWALRSGPRKRHHLPRAEAG
jgi:hypothetical protein